MIHFGFATLTLKVNQFSDARLPKEMMAPPRPLIESKMSKQLTEILERNVGIRCSSENFSKKFVIYFHVLWNLPRVTVVFARKGSRQIQYRCPHFHIHRRLP